MKLLLKDSLLKIKKTIGRFLSVLFIVALGIGFFAGLRETTPDILLTLDSYYDENNLMDFQIVSTMGLTEDDLASLKELEYVEKVVPSYSVDALVEGEAIRIHALEDEINQVSLVEGTMPQNANDCVADATKYQIGDIIQISKLSVEGALNTLEYRVVGLVKSPMYLSKEMGIAQIGSGKLESFLFIPKENFDSEYYTEIYLTAKNKKEKVSYQDEYLDSFQKLNEELLQLKPIRETKRYEEILEEATKEIQKIEDELEKEKSTALSSLEEAKKKLDQSRAKLDQGKRDLANGEKELAQKEQVGRQQLADAKAQLQAGKEQFLALLNQYSISIDQLDSLSSLLQEQIAKIEAELAQLEPDDPRYEQYQKTLTGLKEYEKQLNTAIETRNQLENSEAEIIKNEQLLERELASARNTISNTKKTLESGEAEWQKGYQEYQQVYSEYETKIQDAEKQIQEAKDKLAEIEKPEWYLLDREDLNGYLNIWSDAKKVDSIAQIFPVFFILVVALMCFNTMNRMIEEERGQIGILSSLGYGKFKIMSGYLFYVFLATIIGVVIGLTSGYTVIPTIIYQIYHANYILPTLIVSVKLIPFSLLVCCSLLLMFSITIISCLKELRNYPATILRPKAPKMGKKVLLERVSFLWKRLSFTSKVTVRNMFRYKKRIIMTVLGVAGSSALLLTGFGLRDSINQLSQLQYGNIIHYDSLFVFNENYSEMDSNLQNDFLEQGVIKNMPILQESYTFEENGLSHNAYMIVASDPSALSEFVSLHSRVSDSDITLSDNGVVITEKMATLLNAKVGDQIKVRNSQNELFLLKVADIVENYTLHYIYMSPSYYQKVFQKELNYNMMMANLEDDVDQEQLAEHYIDHGVVSTINFTKDNMKVFDAMIDGLNKIVYLIIVASCMLAFIVLYNLTTINITERIREISTLKVLGFYDNEVSSYVYRETLLLTIFGIIAGLFVGIGLHQYVMTVAETDEILFMKTIHWISYVFSFVITIFFGIVVQIFTYFKLKKIDMIESLKSLE